MFKNHLKQSLLLTIAALIVATSSLAQTTFVKGKLYHIISSDKTKNILSEKSGSTLGTSKLEKKNATQYWKVSELSGSWRFINPLSNQAIRANGNQVELGENNGSDELQLWQYEDGILYPTNRPDVAAASDGKGNIILIARDKAKGNKAAKFLIEESEYAGFDDDLTYLIRSAANSELVLGNGDSGENNARIVAEKANADNRGQYWNIKTIDLFTFAVENAFYSQNFDDGGNNANINYLLQWPAVNGVWNNAKFHFEPVEGNKGCYRIVSAGKSKMYTLVEGRMMLVDHNTDDKNSWFTFEQVEKPKI